MTNNEYDYLKKWAGWTGTDLISRRKLADQMVKDLGIILEQALNSVKKFDRIKVEP